MSDGTGSEGAGVEQRLQNLEAQNRALRRIMIVSLVGLAVAMAVLAQWVVVRNDGIARFKTVEAERFVVRDSLNQPRGVLGMWSGLVRLSLGGDERSARGIVMGVGPTVQPQITLKRGNDGPALMLTEGSVDFQHRHGQPGVHFYLHRGVPWLWMVDTGGHLVFNDSLRPRR